MESVWKAYGKRPYDRQPGRGRARSRGGAAVAGLTGRGRLAEAARRRFGAGRRLRGSVLLPGGVEEVLHFPTAGAWPEGGPRRPPSTPPALPDRGKRRKAGRRGRRAGAARREGGVAAARRRFGAGRRLRGSVLLPGGVEEVLHFPTAGAWPEGGPRRPPSTPPALPDRGKEERPGGGAGGRARPAARAASVRGLARQPLPRGWTRPAIAVRGTATLTPSPRRPSARR